MTKDQEEALNILFFIIQSDSRVPDNLAEHIRIIGIGSVTNITPTVQKIEIKPEFEPYWHQLSQEADAADIENTIELISEGKISLH